MTKPGVYEMDADVYHGDPVADGSLSSSGARTLLPPGCPALFRYERDHGRRRTKEMNLGTAAHKVVLGAGADLVDIDADNYRTSKAQATRDEALAAGKIPLLPHERAVVDAMAAALRKHPAARALFGGRGGKAEQALFWVDQPSGIWRRALVDWLPARRPGRMVLPDYKTCAKADPDSISRSVYQNGYHQQADWYADGVKALGLATDVVVVLVFQERTPPYLVTATDLDVVALKIGAALNRQAIELYRECREAGHWPGYADDVIRTPLPAWAENRHMEDITS